MQARLAKARWISVNVEEGGSARFLERISNIWGNSYATSAILHFLLFDPQSAMVCVAQPNDKPHCTEAHALCIVRNESEDVDATRTWHCETTIL